jgi:ketol-acid reductoisomerase
MLYDADCDAGALAGRKVAVLGFGAQGQAQAQNLRDSGVDVVVGLRPGSASAPRARALGLNPVELDAALSADVLVMLVPDAAQPALYAGHIAPRARAGTTLVFAHGFNLLYGGLALRADLDVVLVAPLGIGDQVRDTYARGGGVPGLVAVHQDASGRARASALAYARAQGHGRAGIIETSVREETETDLFAEQAVLCGGLTHLIAAAFDTLVEAGYAPEVAYFCCLHEVKLIADLVQRRGIAGMRESISLTAEFGDYTRGPRVIGAATRAELQAMLAEVRSGAFALELAAEVAAGAPTVQRERARARDALIEQVGARLRARMKSGTEG